VEGLSSRSDPLQDAGIHRVGVGGVLGACNLSAPKGRSAVPPSMALGPRATHTPRCKKVAFNCNPH
jgi:hypothetical protein